ncbi:MAG TPA: Stk1 family PASTA domain-containing Ser/Thr kinase [Acidimicrobiales bacterium]|nr:Stk1 family PASTA domain-containing Ser/Thr kinase [Acidimicrobiales bacterium]
MEPSQTPRVLSGRYELSHLVARGGMAEVYRAHDRLLDRPVALKILFPELSVDRAFVERFRREAQAAANLSHPNIVPVFDWGEDSGTYFIVMEFIDGRALSSILRGAGPMHPDRAAEIASDVAIALAYAHRHGVVHRDVKPGNVLITEDGIVKVTDFGIARAINTEESLTQTGAVMGTATYFSPEQAEGMGVDARSDIYSLGVVLFEMVTGRPPFLGDTPVAVASKHVRENPPTPREINPSVPPDLEAIILKCLAKAPDYRYATGDDLRTDLLRFREGRAVGAVAPPTTSMGTTQAVALGGTQTLHHIAGQETEEPERSRTGLYAGILLTLLVALAVVIAFLGQSLGWWHLGGSSDIVTIPNLAGQSVTQAERTLHNDGLKTRVQSDPTSNTPNTTVIRTNPAKNAKVHKATTVTLVTGGLGGPVLIPALVTQSVVAATSTLRKAGLQAKVVPAGFCTQQNIVCSQSPKAGLHLLPGKTVTLFTAATPVTTTTLATTAVPNVATFTTTQACNAIVHAGFVCGNISMTSSNQPVNTVVSTNPAQGTLEPAGTTINLIESSGPSSVTVPLVATTPPETNAQATTTLQSANLTVASVCSGGGSGTPVPNDPVLSQNPAGGATAPTGSQVTLTVDCSGNSGHTGRH